MTIKLGTLKSVDLHRILSNAIVFASTDTTLPPINMVRMEFNGTDVLAVSTDRFRLGVSHTVRDGGEDLDLHIPLADAMALAKMAKCLKSEIGWRTVDVEYETSTARFRFNDGKAITVMLSDSAFPAKWRQFFPPSGSGTPRAVTAFTAEYLASFGKVNGGDTGRITVFSHDNEHGRGQKALTVTIGEDFVGLLFPVKLGDDDPHEWAQPAWLA